MRNVLLALAFLLAAAAAQDARGSAPPHARIRVDATTLILPPGTIPVPELVDACARFLGRNILMQPEEATRAKVSLQTEMTLDAKGCEDVLSQLLDAVGFVIVPRDQEKGLYDCGVLTGARARELMRSPPQRTPAEILARPKLRQPVTTTVRLHNLNPTATVNALRPFFLGGHPSLQLGQVGDSRSIVISGMQDEVAAAIRLVQEQDGEPQKERNAAPAGNPAPASDAALAARVAQLERTVAELKQQVADLRKTLDQRAADK